MFYSKMNNVNVFFISLLFLFSFGIFTYYLMANSYMSYYDETGYLRISKLILQGGVFTINEPLRTYLYPLIISFFSLFSNGNDHVIKIHISLFQYCVYLFTILYLAHTSIKIIGNKVVWFTIVIIGILNPYLIQATTLLLTDVLASCFIVIGFTYFMNSSLKKNVDWIISIGLCFSSVMIRPSALLFLPILCTFILFRYFKYKDFKIYKGIFISLLLLLVFAPQLYNNVKYFNHWTPLIHQDLYSLQSTLATTVIKYSTVIMPNENPSLFFTSPVLVEQGTNMYQLIFENFFYFLFLFISHIFGAIDWGYVDTYIKEFYPDSRIPASIFLYTCWFLIIVGLVSLFRNFKYKDVFEKNKFKIFTISITILIYILFIGTTFVEARFGYPIFLFLLPFSGYGMNSIFDIYNHNKSYKSIIKYVILCISMILLFFSLSFLSDKQTKKIDWFAKLTHNKVYEPIKSNTVSNK